MITTNPKYNLPPFKALASWLLILTTLSLLLPQPAAAMSLSNLEQQINISDGEFSTANTTDSPTDNSLGLINFDTSKYTGATVYFEAVIRCLSCSGGNSRVAASLYNDAGASQATVTNAASTYTRVRTTSLSLSSDDYTVRFKLDATSGTAYIKAARLIIVQAASSITATQTQVEVGNYENSTNTSATALTSPKYYQYDHAQYSGTVNAYLEATLKTTGNSTTSTYGFNSYDSVTENWTTTPANMVDGATSTYAATSADADVELLDGNSNAGTDLGIITAVEVRAFSYQTTDTTGSVTLRPVFGGSSDGDNHNFTPPATIGSAAWSNYIDITTDTNAPGTWSWSDVQNLNLDVVWNANAGSNTGNVASVEIRVTYEDSSVTANVELYNRTNTAVVTTVSSSDNSYTRVRSAALSSNWDTTNDDDYEVRIYTSNAGNPVYVSNAKIIIEQTDSGGLKQVEVVHSQITTGRTQTNTSYTQDTFTNQFDPSHFDNHNSFNVYFETNIYTSAATAYAALYNVTGSDIINDPTNSEITTAATSLTRSRTANLANNADWPTAAKEFDTILKASDSQTTSVTSSWLVIQVGTIDPAFTFTIEGVAESTSTNGITTSVATTITSIPFGNVTVNTPVYAAHKLTVSTNDATTKYTVDVHLVSTLQGQYPGNNIDPFVGSGATWSLPQTWTSPTGTVASTDTGWLGANTSDTDVAGWSSGSGKFGPLDTTPIEVMRNNSGVSESNIYVTYAFEVNVNQPADTYYGQLIYNVLPVY